MALPAPWGYSPVVRPADVAGHSRSRPGWPRCPSWGVPPGAGICCPGWVSPPGPASAALVGCPPQGWTSLPWLGVPPGAGLCCLGWGILLGDPRPAAGSLCSQHRGPPPWRWSYRCPSAPLYVRLSLPRRDPCRNPLRLCPGLQSRALKASQDAGSLTFTKCPREQPLREQGAPGGSRVGIARGRLVPSKWPCWASGRQERPGEGQTVRKEGKECWSQLNPGGAASLPGVGLAGSAQLRAEAGAAASFRPPVVLGSSPRPLPSAPDGAVATSGPSSW